MRAAWAPSTVGRARAHSLAGSLTHPVTTTPRGFYAVLVETLVDGEWRFVTIENLAKGSTNDATVCRATALGQDILKGRLSAGTALWETPAAAIRRAPVSM